MNFKDGGAELKCIEGASLSQKAQQILDLINEPRLASSLPMEPISDHSDGNNLSDDNGSNDNGGNGNGSNDNGGNSNGDDNDGGDGDGDDDMEDEESMGTSASMDISELEPLWEVAEEVPWPEVNLEVSKLMEQILTAGEEEAGPLLLKLAGLWAVPMDVLVRRWLRAAIHVVGMAPHDIFTFMEAGSIRDSAFCYPIYVPMS